MPGRSFWIKFVHCIFKRHFQKAILFINYSIGRMVYQIGYTSIGFGAHVSGFMIDRFSTFTMLSLVLIAGVVMIAYDGPPPDQLGLANLDFGN